MRDLDDTLLEPGDLAHPGCQNCQHPFDFDWPDLGEVYACPSCHRIHKQVVLEVAEDHIYTLLGEITPHLRTCEPHVIFTEKEMLWVPFERNLN